MENLETGSERRRSRPKVLAGVLTTVVLAAGVLLPAAAPSSASAMLNKCKKPTNAVRFQQEATGILPAKLIREFFIACVSNPWSLDPRNW